MASSQITVPVASLPFPQTSPLASIPLEVLLQIVRQLKTPEYGNLRLTCKEIEGSLLNSFSREFFTKRQFMISPFSLQALVDISRSRLGPSLSQVIIGLEQPFKSLRSQIPPYNHASLDTPSQDLLVQEYINNMSFNNTCHDVEMLVEAFSNLPNLVTVGLRDFNSRSRYRDFPDITWKSMCAF
jgi:hypothetical protein